MSRRVFSLLDRALFVPTLTQRLGLARIVLAAYVLFWRLPRDLRILWKARNAALELMEPAFLLKFIPLPYPLTAEQCHVFSGVMTALGVCVLVGLFTRVSLFFFGLGLLYLGAGESSWGWVNHGNALLDLVIFSMAWIPGVTAWSMDRLFLWGWRRARSGPAESLLAALKGPPVPPWGMKLILLLVILVFFSAGLSKLRYSGLKWADGETLSFYLKGRSVASWHQFAGSENVPAEAAWRDGFGLESHLYGSASSPRARRLAQNPFVMRTLSALTLLLELGMPLALLGGWFRTVFLLGNVVFLLSVESMMNIYFRPYLLISLLLIDWAWLLEKIRQGVRKWHSRGLTP